ncbi:hypothetical protein BDM02DRAFT_3020000 [Thelephora ganbajun]|uniref:Uncharacterized protein n=1 Tax=Thelephora ganbajun TaxID=370292 RepID=A0ACB6ZA60_THEGA|nr:hypothetical protein BDM02DRAFT_3020000 [Thelephora ganbajun]
MNLILISFWCLTPEAVLGDEHFACNEWCLKEINYPRSFLPIVVRSLSVPASPRIRQSTFPEDPPSSCPSLHLLTVMLRTFGPTTWSEKPFFFREMFVDEPLYSPGQSYTEPTHRFCETGCLPCTRPYPWDYIPQSLRVFDSLPFL